MYKDLNTVSRLEQYRASYPGHAYYYGEWMTDNSCHGVSQCKDGITIDKTGDRQPNSLMHQLNKIM
jgi:hypothetical protein